MDKPHQRMALQHAYESAVVQAAKIRDPSVGTFAQALKAVDYDTFVLLRAAYTLQLNSL